MEQHEKDLLKVSPFEDDTDLLILAIRRLEDELERKCRTRNMACIPKRFTVHY